MNTIENFTTPAAAYFEQGYITGYMNGYNQAMKDSTDLLELSKPELDMLVHILSDKISFYEEMNALAKYAKEFFYSRCNPEDETTAIYFTYLNKTKDVLRNNKKQRKKLATLQSKLKKMRGV
jgi:hypothetical protein